MTPTAPRTAPAPAANATPVQPIGGAKFGSAVPVTVAQDASCKLKQPSELRELQMLLAAETIEPVGPPTVVPGPGPIVTLFLEANAERHCVDCI